MNVRKIAAAAASIAMAVGGALVAAQPAQAVSYNWIYISAPTWLGNCPGGGSVKFLKVMIGNSWEGGDAGDDLVYGKAYANREQTVTVQPTCYAGKKSYMGVPSQNIIKPTRNNQTWWVGPDGVRSN